MAPRSQKMEVQGLNLDRISSLPQDINGHILTRMPIRDAVRTSILSRKWRSSWKSITRLVFNDKMVKVPSKLASAILNVLLFHTGSIHEIIIEVGELDVDSEFDQIICYLSRNNHLQKMYFGASLKHCYKLPSFFFSLQGLESLGLTYCLFRPPIAFDGLSKLRVVHFVYVDITSETLNLFLSKCPLIKDLSLIADDSREFVKGNKLTFVELLQCVPLIENLEVRGAYMELFSAGAMPHKLPTPPVQLKSLQLELSYDNEHILSSVLCLIRSSPNLKEFVLWTYYKSHILKHFPVIRDYSSFTLDHLENFKMLCFANEDLQMDFLKLIMAKSPMLKKVNILLHEDVSLEEGNKIRRDLSQLPFPASPSVKLIIKALRRVSSY